VIGCHLGIEIRNEAYIYVNSFKTRYPIFNLTVIDENCLLLGSKLSEFDLFNVKDMKFEIG
jgi:hypothetical protein